MIDELRPSAAPIARPVDDELYARVERLVHASDSVLSANRVSEENQQIVDALVEELGDQLIEMSPFTIGPHLIEARRFGRGKHGIEVSVTLVRILTPRRHSPTIYPRPHAS